MNSELFDGPTIALVRAVQEYRAITSDELSLVPGQIYHVKVKQDNGMFLGLSTAGQKGAFPGDKTEEVANLGLTRQSRAATVPLPNVQPLNTVTTDKAKPSGKFFSKFMNRENKSKSDLMNISEPTWASGTEGSPKMTESTSKMSPIMSSSSSFKQNSSRMSPVPSTPPPAFASPQITRVEVIEESTITEDRFYVTTKQSYQAKVSGQLSFSAGDFILVTQQLPTGWWRGTLVGRSISGLFQSSLVEVVDESEVRYPSQAPIEVKPTPQQVESRDLEEEEDDMYDIPSAVPTMVKYGGKSPSPVQTRKERAQTMPETASFSLPPPVMTPSLKKFRAVFPFQAQKQGQVSMKKGDVVMVKDKIGNWWTGVVDGREGLFPATYVREVDNTTSAEEQLDKMHARYVTSTTKYEERIKELTLQLEDMRKQRAISSH